MPRLRFMSAIVRGACVNIFLVALSCVDLKRPAAPYLAYGACVCRFSFFKRMQLRIMLATVRDARASMFLTTLSYGAPKHLEAPYGALRRLRRLRRRFLFFLFSATPRLLRFGPNVDFGLYPLQTRLEPPPKLGMHPHVPVGPRPAELDRGFLAPESCPLAPPAASEAPR